MKSLIQRIFGSKPVRKTLHHRNGRPARLQSRPTIDRLESRDLMAVGGEFVAATGVLTIWGTAGSDVAKVDYATKLVNGQAVTDTGNINISLITNAGYEVNQTFTTTGVKNIVFAGKAGNDYFNNNTSLPFSLYPTTGTVSSSLLSGVPNNSMPSQAPIGVFTVGTTGKVSVDYIFDGAGYRGQLAIYSLAGMEAFTPNTAAYNKEAARRAMSDSVLGHTVISVQSEAAKFSATLSWEGNFNTGHGSYLGPHTVDMTPGSTFGLMLIPNGTAKDVFQNPSAGGSLTPLYSIPDANPYKVTNPLMAAQASDLDGHGSLFSFEDLRTDGSSDRDYNDMAFQITGARGTEPFVNDVLNPAKNLNKEPIFKEILKYAAEQESKDTAATIGTWTSGVGTVGVSGQVGVDYLFDGGGYVGEVAIFSLQGMSSYKPGSPEFIKEATRRALSNTMLGHVIISDSTEAARTSSALTWETDFNLGTYKGIKTVAMTPGDSFGTLLVPAGTVWEAYNNAATTDAKKRPLFSMPEANLALAGVGSDQFASLDTDGRTFGFEDIAVSTTKSDRDFNDIVFRFTGATVLAPDLAKVVTTTKNLLKSTQAAKILA